MAISSADFPEMILKIFARVTSGKDIDIEWDYVAEESAVTGSVSGGVATGTKTFVTTVMHTDAPRRINIAAGVPALPVYGVDDSDPDMPAYPSETIIINYTVTFTNGNP